MCNTYCSGCINVQWEISFKFQNNIKPMFYCLKVDRNRWTQLERADNFGNKT